MFFAAISWCLLPKSLIRSHWAGLTIGSMNKFSQTMSGDHATVSYVTAPSEAIANQLSTKLIEQRLAACVSIIKGVESVYEWNGKIERDTESLMMIKSHSSKSKDLTDFVLANHPYNCPEVITLRVDSGSEDYLKWVESTIKKQQFVEPSGGSASKSDN